MWCIGNTVMFLLDMNFWPLKYVCVNWSFKEQNGSEQIKLCLPLCLMSYILFATGLELRKINSRLTANLKFSHYIMNESEKTRLHSSNMET